jgi:hypothetical protein
MKNIFLTLALITGIMVSAQVRIGGTGTTVNGSAILELSSTNRGVLFPNVVLTGTANATPLPAHVAGMTVYNTNTAGDVTPGMYANNGTIWVKLGTPAASVVTNTAITYAILGTEDIILSNANAGCTMTLPVSAAVGHRIVIANNTGAGGLVSIAVAAGGVFWNGIGFATAPGNSNIFTYTASGWINEAIGLN